MSKANKRERQRQNRELAKTERERLMKRDRRMRAARGLLLVLVPVAIIFVIIALLRNNDDKSSSASSVACKTAPTAKPPAKNTSQKAPAMTIDPSKTYTATIVTNCGTMVTTLDAKTAPIATNNFVSLAKSGFYDGLSFHRVVKQFVIQGGDPKGDGSGGPGYTVVGETPSDSYPVGSLAAAKAGNDPKGSFGSQFFIVTGKNGAQLPNDYARFGKVTQGMAVAKKIEALAPKPTNGATVGDGPPTQKVVMSKVTISES